MPIVLNGTDGITQADQFNSDSTFGFKNRIINGAMVIDQRNAGASVTPASGDVLTDRWKVVLSQASKLSAQQNQNSVTPPVGFTNYLGFTSLSAYSVGAAETFNVQQIIEGFNCADLGWGTANAKTVTLSFWVYSSLTGTFGGSFANYSVNRSYPFTYSIPVANTWTQISITVAGDTTGTWNTNNSGGIRVWFSLGCGSSASGTAGSWSANDYRSATGATSVVGTNGATFYITGVQLEVGSTATSFDYRPYTTELQLCQRYFSVINATTRSSPFFANTRAGTNKFVNLPLPVVPRTTPTISTTSTVRVLYNGTNVDSSSGSLTVGGVTPAISCDANTNIVTLFYDGAMTTVGDTANTIYGFMINGGIMSFSAEL